MRGNSRGKFSIRVQEFVRRDSQSREDWMEPSRFRLSANVAAWQYNGHEHSYREAFKGLPMIKLQSAYDAIVNLQDLLDELGGIAPERIRFRPPPGTAKEKHVVQVHDHENRLCELVDGVLVEKAMGSIESLLASALAREIGNFIEDADLGVVLGADAMLRLAPGLVRMPDVSFVSWDKIPGGEFPEDPIAGLVPDLAVEVLSAGNTKRELERKVREYFAAGVRLVWLIDPKSRIAEVDTSPDSRRLRSAQKLDGAPVLPGFELPLRQFFARVSRRKKR
jgi:Uma2 family endonuclease